MNGKGRDRLLGNKIAAALLTAGLIFWGANRIATILVPHEAPKTPAIKLAGMPAVGAAAPQAAPQAAPSGAGSVLPLLAKADVAKGNAFVQQQCAACHTLTQGGANGVGPNLYGVLGAPMFAKAGFSFSSAAKAKAKGDWDYAKMNDWLTSPPSYAPGTAMSYAGIKNTQTRADVIAYLRTLSAQPLPLPSAEQVQAASAPASAAPAAATPAAGGGAPAPSGIAPLFAHADIAKGQTLVQQQCAACHSLAKGGPTVVGPDLYGIMGDKMFARAGFAYSPAVKAKAGGTWTAQTMSDWLHDPMGFAPGTMMAYPGIKNDQTRADVIAYLNKNSDSPIQLPGQ
jgi:cytochrome c